MHRYACKLFAHNNAMKYADAPKRNAWLKPSSIPIAVVITDPSTDITPFTPHIQGIFWLDDCARTRKPEGNGMPIKKPSGLRRITEIIILVNAS